MELSAHTTRSPFRPELSRSPVPGARLCQSLYKKLEELQRVAETSQDLLALAGESVREHSASVNQSNLRFPKSAACQTEPSPPHLQTGSQTEPVIKRNRTEGTQTEEVESGVEREECSKEDCFCPTSQARRQKPPGPWRRLLNGVLYLVVAFIGFTFFCGLQIDRDTYYPASWYPLR